jgi:hypothetical protein
MMRRILSISSALIALAAVCLLLSCADDDNTKGCEDNINASFVPCIEELEVASDQCIVKEALKQNVAGVNFQKFVFFHDGTNYTKIELYENDYQGNIRDTVSSVFTFTYSDGRISEVTQVNKWQPQFLTRYVFTFVNRKVTMTVKSIVAGVTSEFVGFTQVYLPDVTDTTFHWTGPNIATFIEDQYQTEFVNGNRVRFGYPSNEGTCHAWGILLAFQKNYYDDRPNVLADFAVRYPFDGSNIPGLNLQFWAETNHNNVLATAYYDRDAPDLVVDINCWTFLKNNSGSFWIKKFSSEYGQITYTYDCEL